MKYENKDNGHQMVILKEFGGLDHSAALCNASSSNELRNLRHTADGGLSRREGLCPQVTLPQDIRGATAIMRNGVIERYAVAGEKVYYLSCAQDGRLTPVELGVLSGSEGDVEFACHDGALLLLASGELWTLTPTSMEVTEGYVPLYGRDWSGTDTATHIVYEKRNRLSRRVRIRYRLTIDSTRLALKTISPSSVDGMTIDGVPYTGQVSYDAAAQAIVFYNIAPAGAEVEVFLTLPEDSSTSQRSMVTECTHMAAVGPAEAAKLLFYGGESGAHIQLSQSGNPREYVAIRRVVPSACMLYVTDEDVYRIGDGIQVVTGACRHYDRSLLFTTKGTWMIEEANGRVSFVPVNTTLGCSAAGAVVLSGNDPFTLFDGVVLRWNSETDQRDECNAARISGPIEALLPSDIGEVGRLFVDAMQGEIWLYRPDAQGRILVYECARGTWTSFDGFAPHLIFAMGKETAVVMGKTLYLMDATAGKDAWVDQVSGDVQARPIAVEYRSAFLDFGAPEKSKRACQTTMVAACGYGKVKLTLATVLGHCDVRELYGDGQPLTVMQTRGNVGRFRFLRAEILFEDDAPFVLQELRLCARGV